MEIVYLKSFLNDIKKLKDNSIKEKIKEFILEVKSAENLEQINNIKKLKGYSIAYRWRTGGYRLGIYKETHIVEFARFVKRNDIYKVFPKKGTK